MRDILSLGPRPGLSGWSVWFPWKANRAQLEPAGYVCCFRCVGPDGGSEWGWAAMHWTSGMLREWQNQALGAAAKTTLPRGSPISQDLGSSMDQQRNTWVPWVPDSSIRILALPPYQANPNPCQGLSPPLLTVTVRRHFTPGAQPGAGKWAVAQRLCRGRTAGGQDRGVNCTYPTPCGPVDTRH